MGVWGISNLENDTAKDWLVEIGDKYIIADIYLVKGVCFLRTEHPQGKPEQGHIEVIKSIIEKYK